jgi:hypothetical protein
MKMAQDPTDPNCTVGTCDACGTTLYRYRGQSHISCDCGAEYNCVGQRLRDDWRSNPSNYDDEIGDLEGYEIASPMKDHVW